MMSVARLPNSGVPMGSVRRPARPFHMSTAAIRAVDALGPVGGDLYHLVEFQGLVGQ